jgi:hypothetical protein
VKQIQPGSPCKTITTVRFVTAVVSVAQVPSRDRRAIRFNAGLAFVW